MELRKVQLTGGSSISVTLPKPWIERTGIKQGDLVGLTEQPDGSLAVHPHAKGERARQEHTIEVDATAGEDLFRRIIAAYLLGFDAIRIHSKRPLTADARVSVRKAVSRIVGLEVVDEEPNTIIVQDFLDPREFHMDKALRRMAMLTRAMQQEAVQALKEPSDALVRSVRDRDDEVDRLYWLVNKQFHAILRDASYASKMELTANQALNFLLVARLIERTADHAARITEQAMELAHDQATTAFLARLERQMKKSTELFQDSLQSFLKKDGPAADKLINEAKVLQESQAKFHAEAAELDAEFVSHAAFVIESIGRTAAYAADVGEVAINHVVASSG